jgi:hypothetical protein
MTTTRKSQSARANGAKSKGPVTPEGKAVSSQNAVRHGIFSRSIVLGCESQDRFQLLLAALKDQVQPRTSAEMDYVETMAIARWRQMRVWGIQKATIELEMARLDAPDDTPSDTPGDLPQEDPAALPPVIRAAIAFRNLAGNACILDLLHRYETSYERQFLRAHAAIQKLRRQDLLEQKLTGSVSHVPNISASLATETFLDPDGDEGAFLQNETL